MTTALEVGEGQTSRPDRSLPLGKIWYPLYRRLGGAPSRSGQVRKILHSPGFDPRTVQPAASLSTHYATRPTMKRVTPIKRLLNVSFVFSLSLFFRIKQLFCPGEQTSSVLMLKTRVDLQVSFTTAVKTKAEEKKQAFPPGLIE